MTAAKATSNNVKRFGMSFALAGMLGACSSSGSTGSGASGGGAASGGSGGSLASGGQVHSSAGTSNSGGLSNAGGTPSTGGVSSGGGNAGMSSGGGNAGMSSGGGAGMSSSGGAAGGGGGTTTRPSYNTGNGFFVKAGKLYDPNGNEFRIRGVNKLHWDSASPGIPKTHANTERWVVDFSQPTATNLGLMKQSIDAHIVPMPGNWDGTCKDQTSYLTSIVDQWVAQAAAWKTIDHSMILNIANEWGPGNSTDWRDAYITAVGRLRDAGYLSTISIDSGGCGQDNDDLVKYAAAVFDSDPQKNVIFDQHIYGGWDSLAPGLDALAASGLAVIVGEFGPGRNIGPSPTAIMPTDIMSACEGRKIGWLAWAWDDPAFNADNSWFALSLNGDYNSSADLTDYGKQVVEDPTNGLLVRAKPATF